MLLGVSLFFVQTIFYFCIVYYCILMKTHYYLMPHTLVRVTPCILSAQNNSVSFAHFRTPFPDKMLPLSLKPCISYYYE